MPIWDLFSKREARKRKQGQEDVVQYDVLPEVFRVQVIHIWRVVLGTWDGSCDHVSRSLSPNDWWNEIYKGITREKGLFSLSTKCQSPDGQCAFYMVDAPTTDALDLIEVTFRCADLVLRDLAPHDRKRLSLCHPDDAIGELNGRFREHGIGYEFVGSQIVRVDSKYIHAEAVKPALTLLHGAGRAFSGPLEEFLRAHEYYRKGDLKNAILWACKAFESTLQSICTARGWAFDAQRDTANKLIERVLTEGLVPAYLEGQFTALRGLLESGVPTVRNKTSGHGQGPTPVEVPAQVARYTLNMTAANIVFLIESYQTA